MASPPDNSAPLGSDFAGVFDLTPNLDTVVGTTCLAQSLARGLLQDEGSEPDDPTFGLGLGDVIGEDMSDADLRHLERRAERQCGDERVNGVSVSAIVDDSGQVALDVQVASDAGPFRFVVSPSSLTVDLLRLRG
jgi:hypothetical protein